MFGLKMHRVSGCCQEGFTSISPLGSLLSPLSAEKDPVKTGLMRGGKKCWESVLAEHFGKSREKKSKGPRIYVIQSVTV